MRCSNTVCNQPSDEDLARDDAYVYVDKELERASRRSIETLERKDVYFIFPTLYPNTSTQIVLKKPKTVAYILRKHKEAQDELKSFLGDEYLDYNLVITQINGRPCEGRIILKELHKLREKTGLPEAAFYSNQDLRKVKPQEEKQKTDLADMIERLKNSPELAQALTAIIQKQR